VHDSLYASTACGAEQRATVRRRVVVGDGSVGETHPIGVVESGCSAQAGFEARGVGEIQRPDVNG
jgi:hypothetical protein